MSETNTISLGAILAYSNIPIAALVAYTLWPVAPGYSIWAASMGFCYLIDHLTISRYERMTE